jgi:hypothetical protein
LREYQPKVTLNARASMLKPVITQRHQGHDRRIRVISSYETKFRFSFAGN